MIVGDRQREFERRISDHGEPLVAFSDVLAVDVDRSAGVEGFPEQVGRCELVVEHGFDVRTRGLELVECHA